MFLLILAVVSYLFGQYLGLDTAWLGALIVAGMMLFAFAGVLIFGIALNLLDRYR